MTSPDLPVAAVVAVSARYRRGFADLLSSLDPAQLATPSLCSGWDVRTVAGHLVSALTTSVPSFLVQVLRARGIWTGRSTGTPGGPRAGRSPGWSRCCGSGPAAPSPRPVSGRGAR
nr:maleylpyruvate isomerase N-terminal domain-containing protein [Pseudonocardia sp. AL041005-10]